MYIPSLAVSAIDTPSRCTLTLVPTAPFHINSACLTPLTLYPVAINSIPPVLGASTVTTVLPELFVPSSSAPLWLAVRVWDPSRVSWKKKNGVTSC